MHSVHQTHLEVYWERVNKEVVEAWLKRELGEKREGNGRSLILKEL